MRRIFFLLGVMLTPASQALAFEGIVVDSDNQPVADADVFFVSNTSNEDPSKVPRTRTDSNGCFALEPTEDTSLSRTVLAWKEGWAIGVASRGPRDSSTTSFRIVLPKPRVVELRLFDPDGEPLKAKQAEIDWLIWGRSSVRLRGLPLSPVRVPLSRGCGKIHCLPEKAMFSVVVSIPQFGEQEISFPGEISDYTAQLLPVGCVQGQVSAEDPEAVKDVTVNVTSEPDTAATERAAQARVIGRARLSTDEQGRFELPAIAAGTLSISATATPQCPFQFPYSQPINTTLTQGETAQVEIQLQRAVRIAGSVLDAQTSKPVKGAAIRIQGRPQVTDLQGKYSVMVAPGRTNVTFWSAPESYLPPYNNYQQVEVTEDETERELPPYRLPKAVELAGVVMDETGSPAPGAVIIANWQATDGQFYSLRSDNAVSNSQGEFALRRLPADTEVAVAAWTRDRAVAQIAKLVPQEAEELQLTLDGSAAAAVAGRIISTAGKPVSGARISFRRARRIPSGRVYGMAKVDFDGQDELVTDGQGRFRTPFKLPRVDQFSLRIEADGMLRQETDYLSLAGQDDPIQLDDVALQSTGSATGQVVDDEGRPIAEVRIWSYGLEERQTVTAETDTEGQFELSGLHPRAWLVFAAKAGYFLGGDAILSTHAPITIRLTRDEKTVVETLRSVALSVDERRDRLIQLIDPIFPKLAEEGSGYFAADALKRLASFDPEYAVAHIDQLRQDRQRADVLLVLGEVDDALSLASLNKDPYRKSFSFFGAADAVTDTARKHGFLTDALVNARQIPQPDRRVVVLGNIAERLLDMGDHEAARKVVEEGLPIARELAPVDWSGYARGSFAETVALVDVDAAWELADALTEEDDRHRHFGNIAHELADRDPAQAQRFLDEIKNSRYITPYAVRVCYRMARADLQHARRVADSIGRNQQGRAEANQAHAYGVMAMSIQQKDPDAARELLREAFERLGQFSRSGSYSDQQFGVAAALVAFSERVDPQRTRDYFWRALALHRGPAIRPWSPDDQLQHEHDNAAKLVVLLGLYDQLPQLRYELMRPVFEHWERYTDRKQMDFYRKYAVFSAMALTDPEQTIQWHSKFHPKVGPEERRLIPQPWMTIADMFGLDPEDRGRRITKDVFHLWIIDEED